MTKTEIARLQQQAGEAGDTEQVALCERALAGDLGAIAECERVVQVAEAMDDEDR